jgi:hypothetical protein
MRVLNDRSITNQQPTGRGLDTMLLQAIVRSQGRFSDKVTNEFVSD